MADSPASSTVSSPVFSPKKFMIPISYKLTKDNYLLWQQEALVMIKGQKLQSHLQQDQIPLIFGRNCSDSSHLKLKQGSTNSKLISEASRKDSQELLLQGIERSSLYSFPDLHSVQASLLKPLFVPNKIIQFPFLVNNTDAIEPASQTTLGAHTTSTNVAAILDATIATPNVAATAQTIVASTQEATPSSTSTNNTRYLILYPLPTASPVPKY